MPAYPPIFPCLCLPAGLFSISCSSLKNYIPSLPQSVSQNNKPPSLGGPCVSEYNAWLARFTACAGSTAAAKPLMPAFAPAAFRSQQQQQQQPAVQTLFGQPVHKAGAAQAGQQHFGQAPLGGATMQPPFGSAAMQPPFGSAAMQPPFGSAAMQPPCGSAAMQPGGLQLFGQGMPPPWQQHGMQGAGFGAPAWQVRCSF